MYILTFHLPFMFLVFTKASIDPLRKSFVANILQQFKDAIGKLEKDSLLLDEFGYNKDSKNVTILAHQYVYSDN